MIRRTLLPALLLSVPFVTVAVTPAAVAPGAAGTPCASLAALTIPNVIVRAATAVAAGPFTPPGARNAITLPAFCRVQGVARPTSDSEIGFEVWIPPAEAWNGKFQGVGNGGYSGSVSYPALATALQRGYATASTDTGHIGDDLKFGDGHPEKVVDWAHRAIHLTADVGKLIVRNHTGRFPDHSYFVGCSTGGHQALSEAQRYPDDYDGIVAGDPAYDRVHQSFSFLWLWMQTHREGVSLIPNEKLPMITKAAVSTCDGVDGVKDGIIDDPRRCRFDPASLLCHGEDSATCLTAPQVGAVKAMYTGLKNPRTGEEIFPGYSPGSEGFGETANMSWRPYILDPREPMRLGVLKSFLFNDPNWDYRTVDFDRDVAYADAKLGFMSAVDRDIAPFKKHGGKLVMYTGWADPVAAPLDIIKYYEGVTTTMGGLDKTKDFYRFFLVPGMGHCGGGPGPNTFDALGALEQWVEHGTAPDKLIASHVTAGKTDRTRPLCPYPQMAKWKGTGSTDDAANFSCINDERVSRASAAPK